MQHTWEIQALRKEYLMSLDELRTWCERESDAIASGDDPGDRAGLSVSIRHTQAVAANLSKAMREACS